MIINVESEETISRLETGVTFSELWIVSLQKQIAWYQFVFSLICSVTVNTNRATAWGRHWLASYYLVLLTNDGCFQQCVYNNVSSSSGVTLHSVHQGITPPTFPSKSPENPNSKTCKCKVRQDLWPEMCILISPTTVKLLSEGGFLYQKLLFRCNTNLNTFWMYLSV